MGSLAVALAKTGHQVTGSDGVLYEPMKGVLQNARIQLLENFKPENAEKIDPDWVIVGNVVRKDNAEVRAWFRKGTPFVTFPVAVRKFLIQDRKSIVVAGTHGKTTTTSWIAFLMDQLGCQPSYLIGGVPRDLPSGCLISKGDIFVGEGDEYDSAFFDKGPKFLHYKPDFLVLTSIEFDHADIYRDLSHVKESFEKVVSLLPGDGLLVARSDDAMVADVSAAALCPVQTFGSGATAMWKLGKLQETSAGFEFEVLYKGKSIGDFRTPLLGEHNLFNLISGIICGVNLGNPVEKIRPIVEQFTGVRRRQELLLSSPVTLIDDFAHHPTEVAATLASVRRRFPQRKIWALFEPRSATARRNVHQEAYRTALGAADCVIVSVPFRQNELELRDRFSPQSLVDALRSLGKQAFYFPSTEEIVSTVVSGCAPGDIVVVMSNGEFDKIQEKLVRAFQKS